MMAPRDSQIRPLCSVAKDSRRSKTVDKPLLIKLVTIAALAVLLLVPIYMVQGKDVRHTAYVIKSDLETGLD